MLDQIVAAFFELRSLLPVVEVTFVLLLDRAHSGRGLVEHLGRVHVFAVTKAMALVEAIVADVDDVARADACLGFDPLDVRVTLVHELSIQAIRSLSGLLKRISERKRVPLSRVMLNLVRVLRRSPLIAALIGPEPRWVAVQNHDLASWPLRPIPKRWLLRCDNFLPLILLFWLFLR